jgi:[ribosomal protein S5]-alanine N-acetyltransferase
MPECNTLRLRTARLELIAATFALADLEWRDAGGFARELRCATPESWPPPLNDENSQRWFREMLQECADAVGWGLWYLVRNEDGKARVLIGNAGFKGRPANGGCEIGYSLLSVYEGCGYATEAARALISWAFQHPAVNRVSAETLPELARSIRVMEKCGMQYIGAGKPEEGHTTLRYELSREVYRLLYPIDRF